jgi:glutamate racemase
MTSVTVLPPQPNINSAEPLARVLRNELSWLSRAHPNILVVGEGTATAAALSELQSVYQFPVIVRNCGGLPLVLPPTESANTLILHDVAALPPGEQQMLSDWLSSENRRTQVVTTNPEALLPLVTSGAFLATLYYRLNVIYVDVTASLTAIEPAAEAR